MNFKSTILSLVLFIAIIPCYAQDVVYIVTVQDETVTEPARDLAVYLSKSYPLDKFELVVGKILGHRNILLEISGDDGLINNEAYKIIGDKNQLTIKGKTRRAIFNGVYGLLKEIGWNFYLSFEVPPVVPKPLNFIALQDENAPLKGRRIIFNWHNFLSGCTGWDYEQWQQWTDNASKIGFNTVMVHAYGNNPMQSFSFNNQEKELGYLTTTQKGRDWGTQHVNDVRRLYGGEIFTDYEFGSKAAKVPDKEKSKAAKGLMQQVFKHAALKGMRVCFALDVDTWMSNPQNIINTLPDDALIKIGGRNTVNPEHLQGRKYQIITMDTRLICYCRKGTKLRHSSLSVN